MASNTTPHPNAALLDSATEAFGHLFANDIKASKEQFSGKDDPFHLMGLGVCVFLEAVLGMEVCSFLINYPLRASRVECRRSRGLVSGAMEC